MVDYVPINESETLPGAPLTSSLGFRFANNPIAIAQGAEGAPRIDTPAYQDKSLTNDKIADDTITPGKLATVSAGDDFLVGGLLGESIVETSTGSEKAFIEYLCLQGGSCRVRLHQARTGIAGDSIVVIRVNGQQRQIWSTSSASGHARTVDVAINRGDTLTVSVNRTASNATIISDFRITTSQMAFAWPHRLYLDFDNRDD
ncbi:hypothetical protein CAI21_22140 [Alkalilimnicola ehrlichii]|uniref:Uncharacterized protein n=1 Tax=Alkalilimnicola ehrlichii TaxID=351052 RepID=A0A3E0WQM6_9GAMM|nr:hypothetical protein [Alkalilimnicola ehrlichii]RFA24327.1 hypothetical protein CAI21_22140 [Alkalilimnicola ehrlichii]RFA35128.1 hypothetical protein CAL65_13560 [Alkalilimnicola ehrlichii]